MDAVVGGLGAAADRVMVDADAANLLLHQPAAPPEKAGRAAEPLIRLGPLAPQPVASRTMRLARSGGSFASSIVPVMRASAVRPRRSAIKAGPHHDSSGMASRLAPSLILCSGASTWEPVWLAMVRSSTASPIRDGP